jgi:hypothetical protein
MRTYYTEAAHELKLFKLTSDQRSRVGKMRSFQTQHCKLSCKVLNRKGLMFLEVKKKV